MANLAIFASGAGSNAKAIMKYFSNSEHNVVLVLSNKKKAGVHDIARSESVPNLYIKRSLWSNEGYVLDILREHKVEWIALAGFLLLIPSELLEAYDNRIVNIHPSLLPSYGGKGMYGINVHREVMNNRESYSGITIHRVNAEYDKGEVLFQATLIIEDNDGMEDLLNSIHQLEHQYYPNIIKLIMQESWGH